MKAALGIMTTDTKPKLAMEQCKIGDKEVKIYGVAKGSGMIFPNMGTTLAYIFTDANLSNDILSKLLKKILQIHLMLSRVMETLAQMIWLVFLQQIKQTIQILKVLMI